ncbi:MAG: hypothetical protein ACHBN1_37020 [Heteroscytonema crispum UTEX LB 1556]
MKNSLNISGQLAASQLFKFVVRVPIASVGQIKELFSHFDRERIPKRVGLTLLYAGG